VRGEPEYRPRQQVQPLAWERPQEPVPRPLPLVTTVTEPEPQPQPQPKKQSSKLSRRLGAFLIMSIMFTVVYWMMASTFEGGIYPYPGWDFRAWVITEIVMFVWEMSGHAERWALVNCVFSKERG
jgi:hypothetical protein